MPEPVPLMKIESGLEGEDICARLRAAGIKCAIADVPDTTWLGARRRAPQIVPAVLVNDVDLDRARAVVESFEAETATHRVSVCESRPGGDDAGDLGTGYQAMCVCDWTGPLRRTPDEAREDAWGHSKNVATEVVTAS